MSHKVSFLCRFICVNFLILSFLQCRNVVTEQDPRIQDHQLQSLRATTPEKALRSLSRIRDGAIDANINAFIAAGIALAETFLVHCLQDWQELGHTINYPQLFKEPFLFSQSCPGNGSILTGQGDGSAEQGGVGLFQFDKGSFRSTVNGYQEKYDLDIRILEHNVAAVEKFFVREKGWRDFQSYSQALGTDVEASQFNPKFVADIAGYYNGCWQGKCKSFEQRFQKYLQAFRELKSCLPESFWTQKGAIVEIDPTCFTQTRSGSNTCQAGYCLDQAGKTLSGNSGEYLSGFFCHQGARITCEGGCYAAPPGTVDRCDQAIGEARSPGGPAPVSPVEPLAPTPTDLAQTLTCLGGSLRPEGFCNRVLWPLGGDGKEVRRNRCIDGERNILITCEDEAPMVKVCHRACFSSQTHHNNDFCDPGFSTLATGKSVDEFCADSAWLPSQPSARRKNTCIDAKDLALCGLHNAMRMPCLGSCVAKPENLDDTCELGFAAPDSAQDTRFNVCQ